eukprot:6207212-Pleurochrysis_carterae.AAC.1
MAYLPRHPSGQLNSLQIQANFKKFLKTIAEGTSKTRTGGTRCKLFLFGHCMATALSSIIKWVLGLEWVCKPTF